LQRGDRLGDLRHPVGVVVTSPGEHPYSIAVANLIGAGLVGDLEQLLEQAISALFPRARVHVGKVLALPDRILTVAPRRVRPISLPWPPRSVILEGM